MPRNYVTKAEIAPPRTLWCARCGVYHPWDAFSAYSLRTKRGDASCRASKAAMYRARTPEQRIAYGAVNRRMQWHRNRAARAARVYAALLSMVTA